MSGKLVHYTWRILFSGIFLVAGLSKFADSEAFAQNVGLAADGFARSGLTAALAQYGVNMAEFLPTAVRIAGALEVGGALALITGCPPKHAAWMLGLFLVLITPFAHYPILADGKTVDMHHAIQILKNLSLIGACIAIYITNGGVATKAKKA